MSAAATSVEDQLKTKLNLKYSAASRLIQDAREQVGSGDNDDNDDAILKAAEANYKALPKSEQKEMQINKDASGAEPEWQTKARLAAEKREAQWEAEAAGLPPPDAEPSNGLPANVISQTTTTKVGEEEAKVETVKQDVELKPSSDDNTTKTVCYCTIL